MKGGFALDMKANGFGLVPLAYHATAVHADPLTDNLYLVLDENNEPDDDLLPEPPAAPLATGNVTIYKFNDTDAGKMVYRWRSKLYVLPAPISFLTVQVKGAGSANTVFRAYKQVQTAGVWADVLLRELVVTSDEPFRLPMASAYSRFWWEVLGTDDIQSVQVTQDIEELT